MLSKQSWAAVVSGVAAMCLASSAMAVMSVPYGWYLEGNVGSSQLSNKSYPGSSSSSGIGGNANLGYKFMPFFALEIGYSLYPNTTIKNSASTTAGTDKHYSYDIAGRGILPIMKSGAELFAKLGAVRNKSHVTINNDVAAAGLGLQSSQHSSTSWYVGVGGQYYFIPDAAAVIQWQRAVGNSQTGNFDLFSVGASLLFG